MSAQKYNFALNSFTIHDTRSRHEDTDYVTVSLAVPGQPTMTKTKAMGDLNNGTFNPGLSFNGVSVDDSQTAVFSYLIVNNGHSDPGKVEKALEAAAKTLGDKAAQAAAKAIGSAVGTAIGAAIGTGIVPIVGSALGALAGWIVTETGAILFANCDGPVAAGVHTFTGAQLRAGTANGAALQGTDHNPGTDSPTGCGGNSNYDVNWAIHMAPVVRAGMPVGAVPASNVGVTG